MDPTQPTLDVFGALLESSLVFGVMAIVIGGLFWLYISERNALRACNQALREVAERGIEAHTKAADALVAINRRIEILEAQVRK